VPYVPSRLYLERYARLLVNYALGGGAGISPGQVVEITCPENAKPFYVELCRAVWQAGGNVIGRYLPADEPGQSLSRIFHELARDEQIDFFAEHYHRGLTDQIDHAIYVMSETEPHAMRDVDPARIMRGRIAQLPRIEWQQAKENAGAFTWTVGVYGTEAMAAEAHLSVEDYWSEIVAACFLNEEEPAARWRKITEHVDAYCAALNALEIERLHLEGTDVDLWLTLGEHRRWMGGGGRNIPSFEVFTSPDWRGTAGRIRFSEPLYVYGSLITGIELEFEGGRVVSARAQEREELLREMLACDGADRVGEFSLTDARLSPITRFMANTLFDENVGGRYGNTHIAVGRSYPDAYDGDPNEVSSEEWERLGFSRSAVHTDIVSTTDRTVTAVLRDGSERVIFADGRFTLDGFAEPARRVQGTDDRRLNAAAQ
jgi:aminopeptidase